MILRISAVASGVCAALVLAACGTSSPASSSTPAVPSTSPTSATSATSPSMTSRPSSPTPTATVPAVVPVCSTNIRVIEGQSQGAAGHLTLVLIFNNVGHTSCRIVGYPKVALVTPSGAVVAHAQQSLSGMAGGASGIASITLPAGASASSLVEASDVPQGSITDCGSYSLMVTPPNQTVAVPAGTATMPKCEIQVHPVVAGTGGGMR